MTRKELISSPEYWTMNTQLDLYECANRFMEDHQMNRKQLAEHLGVTKSYVTQLLSGDFDHRLSKFVELSLSFGYVPKIDFIPLEDYIQQDETKQVVWNQTVYTNKTDCKCVTIQEYDSYRVIGDLKEMEAA